MSAVSLAGKPLAVHIEQQLADRAARFISEQQRAPTLAAVLTGEDPASQVYVRNKQRACQRVGLESRLYKLPATSSEDEVLQLVGQLNDDPHVDGILVQLPLPAGMRATRILDAVHPLKDVDAFHPENVGLLVQGRPRFLPCTPHGVLQILHHYQLPTAGKHVVVVGRSDIVGKPLANLLVQKNSPWGEAWANATVTLCHSRTRDLAALTRQADVLIAAVGQPRCITGPMVRPGAVVIDVGINRLPEGLVGDVDADSVRQVASHLTPVPGGVGLLTVAMLLENTLRAAESRPQAPDASRLP